MTPSKKSWEQTARAGLVRLSDAVFEKEGKQIPYRKVSLTGAAHAVDEQTPVAFIIKDLAPASATGKNKKRASTPAKQKRSERSEKVVRQKPVSSAQHAGSDSRIEAALHEWQMAEARRRSVPAFRIFSDLALKAMAQQAPRDSPRATRHFRYWNDDRGEVRAADISHPERC